MSDYPAIRAVVEASAHALHNALLECAVIAGADPTAQRGPLDEWVTACVTALADQAREVARERDLLREELRRNERQGAGVTREITREDYRDPRYALLEECEVGDLVLLDPMLGPEELLEIDEHYVEGYHRPILRLRTATHWGWAHVVFRACWEPCNLWKARFTKEETYHHTPEQLADLASKLGPSDVVGQPDE